MTQAQIDAKIDDVQVAKFVRQRATWCEHSMPTVEPFQVFAGEVPVGHWFYRDRSFAFSSGAHVVRGSTDPTLVKFHANRGPGLIGIKALVWVRREVPAETCDCDECIAYRDREAFKAGTLAADEELADSLSAKVAVR